MGKILAPIKDYYTDKASTFGAHPERVDWNSLDSQLLRFKKLLLVCEEQSKFSINDLGCGYGALYQYLLSQYPTVDYMGIDISSEMIHLANQNLKHGNCQFIVSDKPDTLRDYTVASGIFNVKLNSDDQTWYEYILKTIHIMNAFSKKGFAFNCLTKYYDPGYDKPHLYYADPCHLFDYCKTHFSKYVTLHHDYPLYEFTISIKKTS